MFIFTDDSFYVFIKFACKANRIAAMPSFSSVPFVGGLVCKKIFCDQIQSQLQLQQTKMFLPFLKNLLKNVNYSSDVDTMWCPG
jgi:hypothetical protein